MGSDEDEVFRPDFTAILAAINGGPLPEGIDPTERPCTICGTVGPKTHTGACPECDRAWIIEHRSRRLAVALQSLPKAFLPYALLGSEETTKRVACAASDWLRAKRALDSGVWLTLAGPTGAGKTTAAVALMRAYVEQAAAPETSKDRFNKAAGARFVHADALSSEAMEHPKGRGTPPVFEEAMRASVLVVDDVGVPTQHMETINKLIKGRGFEGKQTVITTPRTLSQISGSHGADIARLMFVHPVVVACGCCTSDVMR